MMNLFSTFNPVTSHSMSMNWLFLVIPVITMPMFIWMNPSMPCMMMKYFILNMKTQFKNNLNPCSWSNLIMIMSLMISIMMMNLFSLLPFTFPPSSQLSMNLSLSMIMWLSTTCNKTNNLNKMMSHLTPKSTPSLLIPFMILIETLSLMIQPLTLAIRLTANITAGHIIMTLITQMYSIIMILNMPMHMALMILEISVSMIQAYVFSMLITMYFK